MKSEIWLLYLLLIFSWVTRIHSRFDLFINKLENCDPTVDYINKFYATFRVVEGHQYVDGNATLRVAIDNDLISKFTVDLLAGNRSMQVMKLEEKRTCAIFHRYLGEFLYDLERVAQLVPGLCPVPPGRYHIHNYRLNFDKMTLQNFPFGRLRMREIVTDKNNTLIGCVLIEAENKIL